jgi:hypothetical protein
VRPRCAGTLSDKHQAQLTWPQLGDFINGMNPFLQPVGDSTTEGNLGFEGSDLEAQGLPTFDEMLKVWCDKSGVPNPPKELSWAIAWHFCRVRSLVCRSTVSSRLCRPP